MRLLQSLTRGLQALDYLQEKNAAVRLTDVANALNVDKSNASHILKTLVAAGYAEQDGSRRYVLVRKKSGAASDSHTLDEIVACKERWKPVLEMLVENTRECAHLAVLVGRRVWYIDKIDSSLPLKVDHPIGSLSPLHCTALGKIMLAFGLAEADQHCEKYTSRTITSDAGLKSEIERTRQRGYAIDDEEFAPGIRCVAAAVRDDHDQVIAAIGISGPSVRINDQRLHELGSLVYSAANSNWKEV